MRDSTVKSTSKSRQIYYGWVIVATSALILSAVFGVQYSFGVFFKPLQEAFGWSRAATSLAMTINLVVFAASIVPAAWLMERIGPRAMHAVAAVLVGGPLILCSLVTQGWQLYLLYGVPVGIGAAIAGPASISSVTRWFDKDRGIALGITTAGTGFGALVGAPISNALIDSYGWRTAFAILGIASFFILLVCAYFRKSPKVLSDLGTPVPGAEDSRRRAQPAQCGMTFGQAVRTREMFLIVLAYGFVNFALRVVMVHIAPHATDIGISASVAALAVGTIGGSSILGRLLMGFAQDKIGAKRSIIICLVAQGITMLALPFLRSDLWFFVYAVVFGFMYGGDAPQVPSLTAQCFGLASIGMIWGLVATAGNIGGAAGPIVAGYVFDLTGSYTIIFLGVALSVLAAAFWLRRLR